MVFFISGRHARQNTDRLLYGRLLHIDRLETAFQCRVLFNVLAVFRNGGGADKLNFPSGKGRL